MASLWFCGSSQVDGFPASVNDGGGGRGNLWGGRLSDCFGIMLFQSEVRKLPEAFHS